MVALVIDDGWSIEATAERFQLDSKTVRKWRDRFRAEGVAGLPGSFESTAQVTEPDAGPPAEERNGSLTRTTCPANTANQPSPPQYGRGLFRQNDPDGRRGAGRVQVDGAQITSERGLISNSSFLARPFTPPSSSNRRLRSNLTVIDVPSPISV